MLPAQPPPLLPPAPSRPPAGPPPTIVEDPACPCIDARHLFVDTTASSAVASEFRELGQPCQPGDILGLYVGSAGFSGNTGEGQYCYPASYGSEGCQAYDALLTGDHMCATDAPPSWCAKPWCFVDKETCRRSSADMFGTSLWGDLPVFWSHQTCVTEDVSDADLAYNADAAVIPGEGSGEVLQVGIPTMDYPLHFKRDAAGAIVLGVRRREASHLHTRAVRPADQPRMRARQTLPPLSPSAPPTHTHTHTHTHTRQTQTHTRTHTLSPHHPLFSPPYSRAVPRAVPRGTHAGGGRALLRRQRAVGGLDDRLHGRDSGGGAVRWLQLHLHHAALARRLPRLKVDRDRLRRAEARHRHGRLRRENTLRRLDPCSNPRTPPDLIHAMAYSHPLAPGDNTHATLRALTLAATSSSSG